MEDTKRGRRTSRRTPIIMAISAVTLLFVSLAQAPAFATPPGQNGRIAFRRYFNNFHTRGAIFTIRPDGTGLRQLTHMGKTLLDTEPDWSPDGRWILFDRRVPHKQSQLYKMRANGTHVTLLSKNPNFAELFSSWSPNGKRIAFTRYNDNIGLVAVFVMRADGTHVRQVTPSGLSGQFPQCAPHPSQATAAHLVP